MIEPLRLGLLFAATLGSGLMAGVFFAFSVFIMRALGRLPAAQGIAAMQSINRVVLNPWFLGVFLGTALAGAILALVGITAWGEPAAGLLVAGGTLYVAGTFLVTMLANVPRNQALAEADPASAAGAQLWASYLVVWTAWNHVRTLAALAATACFLGALWLSRVPPAP